MRIKSAFGVLALSATLASCSSGKTETVPDGEMTKEQPAAEQLDVVARYQSIGTKFNAGEMGAETFTENAMMVGADKIEGREAIMEVMARFRGPFPDHTVKAARIFALGDDFLAAEGVSNGTHTAPMGELPPTNNAIGNHFLHIAWFDGDQIKRLDSMANPMTTMQQVGAVPMPEGQSAPPVPAMPAEAEIVRGEANPENEAVATAYFAAMTAGDNEALAALVGPDFKLIHHGMNTVMNFEQAGAHMAMLSGGLSEIALVPEEMWSVGDWVITRAPFSAKHTGELMGMAATNKMVSTPTYQVMKIVDGKVAQSTEYINIMHFAGQMQPAPQASN